MNITLLFPSNLIGIMFFAHHSSGLLEFIKGSYILLAVVMIIGFIICAAIAFTACFIHNKKIKRELQKESEDAEAK